MWSHLHIKKKKELTLAFEKPRENIIINGAFAALLPSFALVSRMPFAQHNHGFGHFFSATSSS
jgi:hypothetical protein